MTISEKLLYATKLLFPTGRAFRISENSVKEKIEKGTIESEVRAYNDLASILDTILPDNDNFSAEDATRWEERLGMIVNDQVSLADRKLAIKRKMNHPGDIIARQSRDYIESQLQLAGFDVYVHENIPYTTPQDILSDLIGIGEMGSPEMGELEMGLPEIFYPTLFNISEMGELEMGAGEMGGVQYNNLIANSISEIEDSNFLISPSYDACFYIGASTIGEFANIQNERKEEFRQLVLRLKPAQTVGILFINYI